MPQIKPLTISVKRKNWRLGWNGAEPDKTDPIYAKIRPKIVLRDNRRCVFCGLDLSSGGEEVHHVDDDHANNSEDNLITTDVLCHAVNHIGLLGDKGTIIHMHENVVSQEHLNLLLGAMGAIESLYEKNKEFEQMHQVNMQIELALKKFSDNVIPVWGTSRPKIFAEVLLKGVGDQAYASRHMPLMGLLIVVGLKYLKSFGDLLTSAGGAYSGFLSPSSWESFYQSTIVDPLNQSMLAVKPVTIDVEGDS